MNRIINCSLSKAIYDDNLETVQCLLSLGKRTDLQDNLGWTPLHAAVNKHRLDMVELLATQPDAPLNTRCYEGHTPLFLACVEKCQPKIISALLIAGADPNIPNNEDVTPLHATQDLETAELLLTFGANVNAQDFNKYTPLHCAVEHDNPELLEIYISAGANTSLRECNGLNPYMLTFQDHFSCVDRLLEATEDINAIADDGWSCLMLAINSGRIKDAYQLLNRGADVNVVAQNLSPLHLAVMRHEVELFKYIVDKVNFKLIKNSYSLPHLMLIHRWYIPERIESYLKILKNPDCYNTMTGHYQNFLGFLFRIELDNKLEECIYEMVKHILSSNIQIDSVELISFVQNYSNCKYKFQLLDLLVSYADFDQMKILQVATQFDPEMVPKMLTYSLSTHPRDIYRFLIYSSRYDFQVLKLAYYVLQYFTPIHLFRTKYLKKLKEIDLSNMRTIRYVLKGTSSLDGILEVNKVVEYLLLAEEKQLMCRIQDKVVNILSTNRTATLRELSRDVIRQSLRRKHGTWRNCHDAVCRLGLPKEILDIIQLKQPIIACDI